jgi:hypothetical protein
MQRARYHRRACAPNAKPNFCHLTPLTQRACPKLRVRRDYGRVRWSL